MAFVRYVAGGAKKNAAGEKCCKVCMAPVPPRRSRYCSEECRMRNSPSWIARLVLSRDKHTCKLCGDTKVHMEADHIIPVSEGGGLCGLEGYRTLCRKCHGKESGALRKRLSEAKKIAKIQREEGRLF